MCKLSYWYEMNELLRNKEYELYKIYSLQEIREWY